MPAPNWANSKWAFSALIFLIIAIAVCDSFNAEESVDKGELAVVFT